MKLQIVPIINDEGIGYAVRRLGIIASLSGEKYLCHRFTFDGEYKFKNPNARFSYWLIKRFRSPKEAKYAVAKFYGTVDINYIDWVGK